MLQKRFPKIVSKLDWASLSCSKMITSHNKLEITKPCGNCELWFMSLWNCPHKQNAISMHPSFKPQTKLLIMIPTNHCFRSVSSWWTWPPSNTCAAKQNSPESKASYIWLQTEWCEGFSLLTDDSEMTSSESSEALRNTWNTSDLISLWEPRLRLLIRIKLIFVYYCQVDTQ